MNKDKLKLGNWVVAEGFGYLFGRIVEIDNEDFKIESFTIENGRFVKNIHDCNINGELQIYSREDNIFIEELNYLYDKFKE